MTAKKCDTPFGYTIFCDDVRFENNGKQIFIGVYNAEMIIPAAFPVRLRALSIISNFSERPGESSDDIRFVVKYSGLEKPIAEIQIERKELDSMPPPAIDPDDEGPFDPIRGVGAIMTVNDLNLPKPGYVEVVVLRGDEKIFLGRLKISHGPIPQSPFPSAPII